MKTMSILFALTFSLYAFANSVEISADGKTALLTGGEDTTVQEIANYVSAAHELGFVNPQGAQYFKKTDRSEGTYSFVSYMNKYLSVSQTIGFVVVYNNSFKVSKARDLELSSHRKLLTLKGQSAELLMGAIAFAGDINPELIVGVQAVQTESGNVVCKKVVAPHATASCRIKL